LAACTIARCRYPHVVALTGFLQHRELAADLARLRHARDAPQERQDRMLGPGRHLLHATLGVQIGRHGRRQLEQHGAAVDLAGVAEHAVGEEPLLGEPGDVTQDPRRILQRDIDGDVGPADRRRPERVCHRSARHLVTPRWTA
jgi:hypothetical protein